MKIKKLLVAILIIAWTAVAQNTDWYSIDTEKDTFYISTEEDIKGLAQLVNDEVCDFSGKTIILTSDVTLAEEHAPIGDYSTEARQFLGTFDGNGKAISNLTVSGKTYAGLFGYVGEGGRIKNTVVNVLNITDTEYAGGLAGYLMGYELNYYHLWGYVKQIENCGVNVSGVIYSDRYSGGLVGCAGGVTWIDNSYSTGDVYTHTFSRGLYSDRFSGGLVGYAGMVLIENSYSMGNVSSYHLNLDDHVSCFSGGLVGDVSKATIKNSYASGNVSSHSDYSYCGGLVGYAYDELTIDNSYATGDVIAKSNHDKASCFSGGLVGYVGGAISIGLVTIDNSYATGNISVSIDSYLGSSDVSSYCGGLVGYVDDDNDSFDGAIAINNSYVTGNVSSETVFSIVSSDVSSYCGGLVGGYNVSVSAITNSYAGGTITGTGSGKKYIGGIFGRWTEGTNTSVYFNSEGAGNAAGTGMPTGILGVTAEQLKKRDTFVGWDFEDIWRIDEDVSMPFLVKYVWHPKNDPRGDMEITHVVDETYTGSQIKPEPKVRLASNKKILKKGMDYELSYGENKNVSTGGHITITFIGDYLSVTGPETILFKIIPIEISVNGASAQNKVYDGTTAAEITVTELAGVLEGDDVAINTEMVTFADKDVGTAKEISGYLTLKGVQAGNYRIAVQPTGLIADITPKSLVVSLNPKIITIALSDDVPAFAENLTYTSFAEGDTENDISGTTDILCSYQKGVSPVGTYPITLQGILSADNYSISYDNADLTLIVTDDPKSVDDLTVSAIPDQIYTGEEITPAIVVKEGETVLVPGTHYSVSYSNNIEIGNLALVTVTGILDGGYKGVRNISFNIVEDMSISILDIEKTAGKMLFKANVVSDRMEIMLDDMRDVRFVVYDMTGNAVYECKGMIWDLRNSAGRFVANGSYLVAVEAKDGKGQLHRYSAKLGVKR